MESTSLPKAMRDAGVKSPEGVTRVGDVFILPNGWRVFGHGACVVATEEDYKLVEMKRGKPGSKRSKEDAEEGEEDEQETAAKEEVKRSKKVKRVLKSLEEVAGVLTPDQKDKILSLVDPSGELCDSDGEIDI